MSSTIEQRSELRDGMRIDWDVPIAMDDGLELRADVFRPPDEQRYPAILSYGPYAKGVAFQDAYAPQWNRMVDEYPEVVEGSSGLYQNWEVVDPERWVPDGYACVRVDSRGTGRSPGHVDIWSPREAQDLYDCIEWTAAQPWSNGKVGLSGISYYAMNQYQVAAMQPPHLSAILPWEGASDWYRDVTHHGGILCDFAAKWYPRQVESVQHGVGERGARSRVTGDLVAGPSTLSEAELAANRSDFPGEVSRRSTFDDWYRARNPDLSRITVPMLSAGNWGGQGLHLRGNVEAFVAAGSESKWLEIHGGAHWTHFYTNYGVELQRLFLAHFLKGEGNGWDRRPPVTLQVRHTPERYVERYEDAWPIPRTRWTRYFLDVTNFSMSDSLASAAGSVTYDPMGEGVTFSTEPFRQETEITGPIAARLYVSAESTDADLFLVVRVFDPRDGEVTFQGALDPNTPISQGWLRASHRKLQPEKSLPHRPYHAHDEIRPLTPGQIYELDIEIWPSCIVVPTGYRVALTVSGHDYQYGGELSEFAKTFHYANRGVGPFTHTNPADRPADVFSRPVTLFAGDDHVSYLMLPIIPPR